MQTINHDLVDASISAIEALDAEYQNAIPVFGGAILGVRYAQTDMRKFVMLLTDIALNAEFYRWHEGVLGAVRTFCNLCFVDTALVEAHIGGKLADLFKEEV